MAKIYELEEELKKDSVRKKVKQLQKVYDTLKLVDSEKIAQDILYAKRR